MNLNETIRKGLVMCFALGCSFSAKIMADEVPCLVVRGQSEIEHAFDLSKLNRITFGENAMTLSSSKNDQDEVQLLYSLFHHLEVRSAEPSEPTGIKDMEISNSSKLIYHSDTKSLSISTDSQNEFIVGIFSLQGNLLQSSKLTVGNALSLEGMSPGVYVAVATDGATELTIKFVIN